MEHFFVKCVMKLGGEVMDKANLKTYRNSEEVIMK